MKSVSSRPPAARRARASGLAASALQTHAEPRLSQLGRLALVLASAAVLAATIGYSARVLEHPPVASEQGEEAVYVPDARFLRVVSLGHSAAVADLLWFRTISYFGSHYRGDRLYPWLAKMCDVVTDLDPNALHVYRFAGVILPWEARLPDQGINILDKGIKNLPDSWLLHYLQGVNYYFFKDDLKTAARYLHRAAELPGAHPYVSRLAAVMYATGYDPAAAESFLSELENSTPDDAMRSVIQVRRGELKLGRDIDAIEAAARQFEQTKGSAAPSLEALVAAGLLPAIPREPFGGRYVLDPATGRASSTSGHSPLRLYSSEAREQYKRGNTVYW